MNTHADVCVRARTIFDQASYPEWSQYLEANTDALQAGATFPDWGYPTGYHDESEDAHWAPWLEIAAQYIHDNYPQPWTDPDTQKLLVFFLGAIGHHAADANWHNLGDIDDGFIEAQSNVDFYGVWGDAHDNADNGGELLMGYEHEISDWHSWSYYFPLDDISAIYALNGDPQVTPQALLPGTRLLALGGIAGRIGGFLLAPGRAKESPFLMEQLQDYFAGGLDDMAMWTNWKWRDYIDLVENGVPPKAATAQAEHHGMLPEDHLRAHKSVKELAAIGYQLWQDGWIQMEEVRSARGVTFRFDLGTLLGALPTEPEEEKGGFYPDYYSHKRSWVSHTPFNYTGSALAVGDFNQDGIDDLVIGAHGYGEPGFGQVGQVHISYGGGPDSIDKLQNLSQEPADVTLTGQIEGGRFGFALAVVDLNADGIDDLAVSSPSIDADTYDYRGKVDVFFGNAGTGEISSTPDVAIVGVQRNTVLGWSLASGDLNGDGYADLVIGAPFAPSGGIQRGFVGILFSSGSFNPASYTDEYSFDLRIDGQTNHHWFGYNLSLGQWAYQTNYLLVGSPTAQSNGNMSVGRLFGYSQFDLDAKLPSVTPSFVLTGENMFDKTGQTAALIDLDGQNDPSLFVASPTFTSSGNDFAGKIDHIALSDLIGDVNMNSITPVETIEGNGRFERLGWRLASADINGDDIPDLLATAPWKNNTVKREAGAVRVWFGGATRPAPAIDNADIALDFGFPKSLFGASVAMLDFNNDGRSDIALSAPRYNDAARNGGIVSVFITPLPTIDSISPTMGEPGESIEVKIHGEGFSAKPTNTSLMLGNEALAGVDFIVAGNDLIEGTIQIDPAATTGDYDLTVTTMFGTVTLPQAFTVEPASDDDDDDDVTDDDDDVVDDDDDTTGDDDDDSTDDDTPVDSSDDDDDDGGCCG